MSNEEKTIGRVASAEEKSTTTTIQGVLQRSRQTSMPSTRRSGTAHNMYVSMNIFGCGVWHVTAMMPYSKLVTSALGAVRDASKCDFSYSCALAFSLSTTISKLQTTLPISAIIGLLLRATHIPESPT
jgi:hypothetical protein